MKILQFPKVADPRGNLTFIQDMDQVPFKIERVFWTYDVPGGEIRGGHAYSHQHEVIIALNGSFDVVITLPDLSQKRFALRRSYYGIYLPPLTWRHMEEFSTNAVGLHLSSEEFNASDYVRDFEKFKEMVHE